VANLAGIVAVFFYLTIISVGSSGFRQAPDYVSLVVMVLYVVVVVPLALWRAALLALPVRRFISEERAPTAEEGAVALSLPIRLAVQFFTYWVGAAVIFVALSAFVFHDPRAETVQIGTTIILGGLTTCALSYLLLERGNRPIFAIVLAKEGPRESGAMGLRPRLLLAWALGSGVALLGIALIPLGSAEPGQVQTAAGAALFLALVGLVAGGSITAAAARSIAEPLDRVRAGLRRVQEGDVEVEVEVNDGGEIGLLQSGFNRMVAGLRERKRLQDLFGRHVGEAVSRQALERDAGLGGEVLEVSALFVDVIGSTALAEARPASEVVATLNSLFGAVVRVAKSEGGWVNKFEGDAALCVFGGPVDEPDHAACALRAARRLREEIASLAELHPGLDAGIGVSSGSAVAGNVGAEERYEYTIIGNPVNESARLSEEAKLRPSRALASAAAVQGAGAEGDSWLHVGEVQLRGRTGTTGIYEPRILHLPQREN
jgi:adenylate cyclase